MLNITGIASASVSLPGMRKFCVSGLVAEQITLFCFTYFNSIAGILSFSHRICYFNRGVKT
jgi:hypothetical protein